MIRRLSGALAPALALLLVPVAAHARDADAPVSSEWRNPGNSVHMRLDRCGDKLCGTVTWASAKARADAARGGTAQLVGTRLFHDLEPNGKGSWRGKVFVPDIRKTFAGTLSFPDSRSMVGKGCVLLGLLCKSQTWSRLR